MTGSIGNHRAIPSLMSYLTGNNTTRRELAAIILGNDIRKPAITPLIAALRHESASARFAARGTLRSIDANWVKRDEARNQVPDFIQALRAKNPGVRRLAVELLGDIGDTRATLPLLEALRDKDGEVRN